MAPAGEVIDLLSSTPPSVPRQRSKRPQSNRNDSARGKSIFDIDDDEFAFTGLSDGLGFPLPELVKRRRLSPELGQRPQVPGSASKLVNLSDEENLPQVKRSRPVSPKTSSIDFDAELRISDAIEFTSSAPEVRRSRTSGSAVIFDLSDGSDSELPSLSQPVTRTDRGVLSERTTNLLANLDNKPARAVGIASRSKFRPEASATSSAILPGTVGDIDDIFDASQEDDVGAKSRKSRLTEEEKDRKAADRAAAKASKEREKEGEKEKRRSAKEQKAQEKQKAAEIAEVNKSKIDKKVSVKEMILDLPRSLENTSVGNQVEAFIEKLEAETAYYDEGIDISDVNGLGPESVGNVIKWRRKVESVYDPEADQFQPLAQKRIEKEKHVLIHITGVEFATIAARQADSTLVPISEAAMKANLDAHVYAVKRKHKGCTPLYLIEGLDALLRKNKNAKNRDYQAAARAADVDSDAAATSASQAKARKRKRPATASAPHLSFFTSDLTNALLLHLQLTHSPHILIHHVPTPAQSAHWIAVFTAHLATRPYRAQRAAFNDAHAGFCMDTGQVRTGADAADAFVRMLQALPRVTPSMGVGVREAGWESVGELVRGFRGQGKLMLQDVRKAVNRDGGVSERRLGPAVSRRLWRLVMGVDPDEVSI